jgi:hypothetical protein
MMGFHYLKEIQETVKAKMMPSVPILWYSPCRAGDAQLR